MTTQSDVDALREKALSQFQGNDRDAALETLQQAMALDPNDAGVINMAATIHHLEGRWDQAMAIWDDGLRKQPDAESMRSNYAAALTQRAESHPGEKIACYRKALELEPDSQRRLRDLGVALQNNRDFAEALSTLETCLDVATEPLDAGSVDGFKAGVMDRMGTCALELGDKAKAIESWETALRVGSWDSSERRQIQADIDRCKSTLT